MNADDPAGVPTTSATSTKPECAMLEYARSRFRFFCASATTLPRTMVIAASHQTATCQRVYAPPNASIHTRRNAANAAAFTAAAMYPVIGVGAPSYTSGVHIWNGAAATLKARSEE